MGPEMGVIIRFRKMCYIRHITDRTPAMRHLWSPWVPVKLEQGRGSFRAQAVSQKTRKKSVSKSSKKVAAVSRSATKGRAKASVKDAKRAAATKSSKNKRSAMPDKTAKLHESEKGFKDYCFEGRSQDFAESRPRPKPRRPRRRLPSPLRSPPPSRWLPLPGSKSRRRF